MKPDLHGLARRQEIVRTFAFLYSQARAAR